MAGWPLEDLVVTSAVPALQLINKAASVYGVSHTNRLSRVDVVTRDEALEFVQSEEQHQQHQQAGS